MADDVYTVKRITNYGTGKQELQGDYAGAMEAWQSGKKLKFIDALVLGEQEITAVESFSYTSGESDNLIFVGYLNNNFVTYEFSGSGVTGGKSETHIGSLYVDGAKSFFLTSSSGKLFRIIVSDTGELSTEEAT